MPSEYPPKSHVLRDLPFELEVLDSTRHRARVAAGTGFGTSSRSASFGSTAIVVDVMAGALCMGAIAPDWMATSVLGLHLAAVPTDEDVLIEASLIRAGQHTVTVDVAICADAGRGGADGTGGLGGGVLTFSRLKRRESNLDIAETPAPGSTFSFAESTPGRAGSLEDTLGCVVVDGTAGLVEMPITDYIRNSFGAVNGGVVATVADVAARSLGSAVLGSPARTIDATVHYLGQGRRGPVRTAASLVRADGHTATLRVDVIDDGQPDDEGVGRLMAIAHLVVSGEGSRV